MILEWRSREASEARRNSWKDGSYSLGARGLDVQIHLILRHPSDRTQDDNAVNQANERYQSLRSQARHEGDEAHK